MMSHAESTEGTEGVSRKSGKSFLNTKQSSPRITSISCIRGLIKYSIDSLDLRETLSRMASTSEAMCASANSALSA